MGQGINRLRQAIQQNKSGLERAALPNPALPPAANQYSTGDFRMADKQNAEKYKVSTGDFRMADKANTDTAVRKYGTNFTALPQNMGVSSDKTLDERIKALENEQRTLGLNTRTMNVAAGQAKFDKYTELEAEINRLKDLRGDGMSLGEHFAYGTGRTLEGLASAGNAIVHGSADLLYGGLGKLTGVFGKNNVSDWFYDQARKSAESDLFGEKKISEAIERDFGDKLTDADRISGGLIKSGSSLLGNVAAGSLAGLASGAGALSSASTMASKAIFSTGAYRSGVQEALSEGANIEDATAYGALSATLSLAVENIASGIPGLDNANSITSKMLDKLKNTPQALKTLTSIIGEGGEEVLEALISPYLQRITYNPDAETATLNELTQAFASGTILSGLMQGGNITAGKLADVTTRTAQPLVNPNLPPVETAVEAKMETQPDVQTAQPLVNPNLPPLQTSEQTQPDVQQTKVQAAQQQQTIQLEGKAANYLRRAERLAEAQIGKALSVPSEVNKEYLRPVIDGMAQEYLSTGDISTETVNRVFDATYPIGNTSNEFIQDTKYEFNKALDEFKTDLRNVKRYTDQRAAELKEQDIQVAGKDLEAEQIERIKNLWKTVKEAKRASEKAVALNLLTDEDNAIVNRLLRNEIKLEDIPKTANYKGIKEVYEAKKAYNAAIAPIAQFNNNRKNALLAEADEFLINAHTWKDKAAGFFYSRETMERNIHDIVPDKAEADTIIEHYIKPVHQNEAERNRMKNTYRDRVRSLNLSRKVVKGNAVSEAYAVQFLGEAEDNIAAIEASKGRISERNGGTITDWKAAIDDLYKNNPNLDYGKIKNAVAEFRNIYNELFDQMNEARIRNGYEPVDYRRGYFPHFKAEKTDGLMAALSNALGVNMEVTALPTSINGITHTFRPGIRWSGNILRRTGFETAYDAVEGFDRYIEGISDVIHHTGDIQKLRALSDQIRYKYSDDNIKKEVSDIRARTDISDAEKQSLIEDKLKNANTTLSNFVVELEEYTNLLANKRAFGDRSAERKMGRNAAYNIMKAVTNRVAANMVAVNPASWLTNFIPLTQGWGGLKTTHLLNGMWDTLKAYKTDDGFVDKSTFLTNRRGSDPIVRTWTQSATATMGKGMEYIDYFTADSLVRARYYQNLQEGLGEVAAMEEADSWAASVMADRSKGSLPTLFEERNPATKIFTQFQLEVNNQLSHLLKDIPRSYRDKGTKALAAALMKFFFGAFLYNELYEKLIGRRPALDPIGILADTTRQEGLTQAGTSLVTNIAEDMPFIGGLIGGGRLPISSALPDVGRLWSAGSGLLSGEMDKDKALHTLGREIIKPAAYILPPFGGGQIKKAAEGISAVASSGSYTVDSQGRDILQYPIYNPNLPQTAANYARAVVFGKSSLPGAQDWIESGFKSSSARETAVYKELVEMGSDAEKVYSTLEAIAAAEKTDEITGTQAKREVLAASDLSDDEKYVVYYNLLATDNEKELMDMLPDKGEIYAGISEMSRVDPDTVREYIEVSGITERQAFDLYREINTLKPDAGTSVTTHQKISVILSQNLSAKQKADLVGTFFTANDKEGNIKTEALLPYLNHTERLLTLYKDTGDSEIISMKVPEEFFFTPKNAKISTKYELTETEKKLFKDTFITFYNGYISKDTTAEQAKKIRSAAYEAAKIAVVQRRRG